MSDLDQVVCINDGWRHQFGRPAKRFPVKGMIYTIVGGEDMFSIFYYYLAEFGPHYLWEAAHFHKRLGDTAARRGRQ